MIICASSGDVIDHESSSSSSVVTPSHRSIRNKKNKSLIILLYVLAQVYEQYMYIARSYM